MPRTPTPLPDHQRRRLTSTARCCPRRTGCQPACSRRPTGPSRRAPPRESGGTTCSAASDTMRNRPTTTSSIRNTGCWITCWTSATHSCPRCKDPDLRRLGAFDDDQETKVRKPRSRRCGVDECIGAAIGQAMWLCSALWLYRLSEGDGIPPPLHSWGLACRDPVLLIRSFLIHERKLLFITLEYNHACQSLGPSVRRSLSWISSCWAAYLRIGSVLGKLP